MRAELKSGDVTIPLFFGMMAIEEIGTRQSVGVPGWFKLITDVIYGGYINEVNLSRSAPEYDYRAIAEIVEEEILTDSPQLAEIFKAFESSKAAQKMQGVAENVKKKPKTMKRTGTK